MKKILCILLMVYGFQASAQQFKDFSALALLGSGVAVEVGKGPELTPVGYYFGSAFEFGPKVSKDADFSLYARGEVLLIDYVSATALIGLRDFYAMTYGMSLRGNIPLRKGPILLVEPMWRNDSQSRLVVGLKWRL